MFLISFTLIFGKLKHILIKVIFFGSSCPPFEDKKFMPVIEVFFLSELEQNSLSKDYSRKVSQSLTLRYV